MGKKSREKRERKAGAAPQAKGAGTQRELDVATLIVEALRRDDPRPLYALAAFNGGGWLLLEGLPGGKVPFAVAAAGAKKGRCLAAYIDIAARESGARAGEEDPSDETSSIYKRLGEAVFGLSVLASAAARDGEPHPSEPIRDAIGSLFDHLPDELLEMFEARLDPLVAEDWAHVRRERLAEAERAALEAAAGPARATQKIHSIDD